MGERLPLRSFEHIEVRHGGITVSSLLVTVGALFKAHPSHRGLAHGVLYALQLVTLSLGQGELILYLPEATLVLLVEELHEV